MPAEISSPSPKYFPITILFSLHPLAPWFTLRSVSTVPPLAPAADPFAPIGDVILRLAQYATELYTRLPTPAPARPTTPRDPPGARRAISAFLWLVALATTLAGDRTYLPLPKREPANPAPAKKKTRPHSFRPRTEDDRERELNRRIRHVFATVPLGIVAERIARRLGLSQNDPLWPSELSAITATPAVFLGTEQGQEPCPPTPIHKGAPLVKRGLGSPDPGGVQGQSPRPSSPSG
jgi:hypothetical protein